jgi:putative NADPH-quinone reductase
MTRILAISGSYRDGGITDQAVATAAETLQASGAEVDVVRLRDHDIEFCTNCRSCMQEPGTRPGPCIHADAMQDLVERIESADGYILAAPTNMGSVTAVFKRFLERLAGYAYWPWGQKAPVYRKVNQPKKRALLISSCAAPGFLGRLFYSSRRQLRFTAEVIGARPAGTLFIGLAARQPESPLPPRAARRAQRLAGRML